MTESEYITVSDLVGIRAAVSCLNYVIGADVAAPKKALAALEVELANKVPDLEEAAGHEKPAEVVKKEDLHAVIRELMIALEYCRFCCEHAEGRLKIDRARLQVGMSVGIRTLDNLKRFAPDFQQESYWSEVWEVSKKLGIEIPKL